MRKLIPALLLAVSLPTIAVAGPLGGHKMNDNNGYCGKGPNHSFNSKGDHGMDMGLHRGGMGMMSSLNLTPEQHDKLKAMMGQNMKHHRDIRAKYWDKLPDADKKAMQAELDKSREESKQAFRQILTAEQQKKFDEVTKRQDEQRKEWQEFQAWKAQKAAK